MQGVKMTRIAKTVACFLVLAISVCALAVPVLDPRQNKSRIDCW